MTKEQIQKNAAAFKYLFRLQTSGRTNMFGAAPYLQASQGLDKAEACTVLGQWMDNYEVIAKELGVEV